MNDAGSDHLSEARPRPGHGALRHALDEWRGVLGDAHVILDERALAEASTATFATIRRVLAILRPASTDEVQECMRIANRCRIRIYPVSRGKNYGLGSRVPPGAHSVLLDLGRLDRIVDYDERLAYITVEPGVSFRQVHQFLQAQGSRLHVSVIGGPAEASVIGNLVERGDGIGPYGERLDAASALEVVLPTGERIHTGFGRFAGVSATPVGRYGVGPHLDGLFTQSNLGIITRATVALMRTPKGFRWFTFELPDPDRLGEVIDALRELVLDEVIRGRSVYLWNSYKMMARNGRFPWELTRGRPPLALEEHGRPEPWYGFGALYAAHPELASVGCRLIEAALAGSTAGLAFHEEVTPTSGYFLGIPGDDNLRSTYWRKRGPLPAQPDPDRDGCGVMWLCPLFPLDGREITTALRLTKPILRRFGFEPNVGLCNGTGRVMHGFVAIVYDREVAGEDERAVACHDEVARVLMEAGHCFYRLGVHSMDVLPPAHDSYGYLLSRIKRTLDPNDVLAPGRYDFRKDWPDRM